ncbi:MAG: hypothetical protein GKR92_12150 [Gammaproteobacteria bacterium]|nr:MAG: hypothetical protein GKR92_12150 [Gammaproteobacteria bacterium]
MDYSITGLFEAFSEAPRPNFNEITTHAIDECTECKELSRSFEEYSVVDVPDTLLEYHGNDITLFSSKAFRYYLPSFIKYAIEVPDSNAHENILYNLSPDDPNSDFWSGRCDQFNSYEKEALISYLKYRLSICDVTEVNCIDSGIKYWNQK